MAHTFINLFKQVGRWGKWVERGPEQKSGELMLDVLS